MLDDGELVVLVAEIGPDMGRFPSPNHLLSWAGLCPRNDESAGKRRSTRVRDSGKWLKTTLVQAAWSAVRTTFERNSTASRLAEGPKAARIASSLLRAVFFMLRDGVPYRDLGGDYFSTLDRTRSANRLIKKLTGLGYDVSATPIAPTTG